MDREERTERVILDAATAGTTMRNLQLGRIEATRRLAERLTDPPLTALPRREPCLAPQP